MIHSGRAHGEGGLTAHVDSVDGPSVPVVVELQVHDLVEQLTIYRDATPHLYLEAGDGVVFMEVEQAEALARALLETIERTCDPA